MAIVPDTKDWTWVLDRACPECGFDARAFVLAELSSTIRATASAWGDVLRRDDVGRRPTEQRWSALEYACHVRDVFRLYDTRLELMLTQDDPLYPNWDQDASAIDDRYAQQSPAAVAVELMAAAEAISVRFECVSGDQWRRRGQRSDGARFDVESFARYFVHDPIHHLHDVGHPVVIR